MLVLSLRRQPRVSSAAGALLHVGRSGCGHTQGAVPPLAAAPPSRPPASAPEAKKQARPATQISTDAPELPPGADRLIHAPAQLDDVLPVGFDAELRQVQSLRQIASEASTLTARADVYGLLNRDLCPVSFAVAAA